MLLGIFEKECGRLFIASVGRLNVLGQFLISAGVCVCNGLRAFVSSIKATAQ